MPTREIRRFFGKGPLLEGIDDLAGSLDAEALLGVLGVLEASNGEGLASLALRLGVASPEVAQHLEGDWFGAWWGELQPVEPIVRAGLARAVWLALFEPDSGEPRGHPLPIDALWLSGVDRFEAGIAASGHQVTLLLLTPPVPAAEDVALDALDPVWMVHRGPARGDEQVVASADGLVTTRVRTRARGGQAS